MMKRLTLLLSALFLVFSLTMIVGCGDESKTADTAGEAATETVAKHDCAGGCGMKDVAEDKMTEVDGKYYCAGCATKAKKEAESHEGHGHG